MAYRDAYALPGDLWYTPTPGLLEQQATGKTRQALVATQLPLAAPDPALIAYRLQKFKLQLSLPGWLVLHHR